VQASRRADISRYYKHLAKILQEFGCKYSAAGGRGPLAGAENSLSRLRRHAPKGISWRRSLGCGGGAFVRTWAQTHTYCRGMGRSPIPYLGGRRL